MAGFGSETRTTHEFLAQFAPERLTATSPELIDCIDAITERVTELGETIPKTSALECGINSIQRVREHLESGRWPVFMAHDQIGFDLTHNLGGLGLIQESSN